MVKNRLLKVTVYWQMTLIISIYHLFRIRKIFNIFFIIAKNIQLIKPFVIYSFWYFWRKIIRKFVLKKVKKVKIVFWIHKVKFSEKNIYGIGMNENTFLIVFWTFLTKKVSLWGLYRRSKKFSSAPLNLSHQDVSLK